MLELHNMINLLSTPDFDGLPCLQKLTLDYCDELEEIHPSLGNHRNLEYVRVSRCRKLRMFPAIVQMEKLKTLEMKSCHKSLEFPEIQAKMEGWMGLEYKVFSHQLKHVVPTLFHYTWLIVLS